MELIRYLNLGRIKYLILLFSLLIRSYTALESKLVNRLCEDENGALIFSRINGFGNGYGINGNGRYSYGTDVNEVHRESTGTQSGLNTVPRESGRGGMFAPDINEVSAPRGLTVTRHVLGGFGLVLYNEYLKRCKSRAAKILKDSTHPGNHLFCLLPSGKRFRSMMAKTARLRRSFFPQAIRLLNTVS